MKMGQYKVRHQTDVDDVSKYDEYDDLTDEQCEWDNLTRDAIAAERAGMSYGKWKAMHPNTKKDLED